MEQQTYIAEVRSAALLTTARDSPTAPGAYAQALEPKRLFSDLLESSSGDRVYIQDGKLSLSNSTTLHRLIPTFVNYIQHIAELVHLPDMILPLNPADEPLAKIKSNEEPTPLLAFCKTPGFSDILMPNTIEGVTFIPRTFVMTRNE